MNSTTFDKNNTKYILGIMKITTSFKIDKDIKEKATKLAASLGLTLSAVINHSLRKFITEKKVTFEQDPPFNKKTEREMLKIMDDIKKGKNIIGTFDNIKDLKASLLGK